MQIIEETAFAQSLIVDLSASTKLGNGEPLNTASRAGWPAVPSSTAALRGTRAKSFQWVMASNNTQLSIPNCRESPSMPSLAKLFSVPHSGVPSFNLTGAKAANTKGLPRESFRTLFRDASPLSRNTFDVIHGLTAIPTTREGAWLRVGEPANSPNLGHHTFSGMLEAGESESVRVPGQKPSPTVVFRDAEIRSWQKSEPVAVRLWPDTKVFTTGEQRRAALLSLKMLSEAKVPVSMTGTRSRGEFTFTSITANVNGSTNPL